jgi:hypothetical protein
MSLDGYDDAASHHQPYHEPLRATLTRTIAVALVAGAILARSRGGLAQWPVATIVMLWPTLGGHYVELWFLNGLRPRLPATRSIQTAARVGVWFVGGIVLATGMWLTARTLTGAQPALRPGLWWIAGVAFIAVELVPHTVFQLRGRPSAFNGRG